MTHLVVVDYPYHSTKKLFDNKDDAMSFSPSNNPHYYPNKLLSCMVFELKTYTNESRYEVDVTTVIKKKISHE